MTKEFRMDSQDLCYATSLSSDKIELGGWFDIPGKLSDSEVIRIKYVFFRDDECGDLYLVDQWSKIVNFSSGSCGWTLHFSKRAGLNSLIAKAYIDLAVKDKGLNSSTLAITAKAKLAESCDTLSYIPKGVDITKLKLSLAEAKIAVANRFDVDESQVTINIVG